MSKKGEPLREEYPEFEYDAPNVPDDYVLVSRLTEQKANLTEQKDKWVHLSIFRDKLEGID